MIFNRKTISMNYCNIFQGIIRPDNLSLEGNRNLIDVESSLISGFSQGGRKGLETRQLGF